MLLICFSPNKGTLPIFEDRGRTINQKNRYIMKTIFVVYTCDAWHSHASKRIFGVFTTKNKAILALSKVPELSKNDMKKLCEFSHQTQGLDENFILEEIELNKVFQ
jgi:hypothetical protein